jgi:hypothetical protein
VSHLLPNCDRLYICDDKDVALSLETDDKTSATNSPVLIAMRLGHSVSRLHHANLFSDRVVRVFDFMDLIGKAVEFP